MRVPVLRPLALLAVAVGAACADGPAGPGPARDPAHAALATRPWAPADRSYMFVYGGGPFTAPAVAPPSEGAARDRLARFAAADPLVDPARALALYDDAVLRDRVPAPALRALAAAASGYPGGEAAVAFLRDARTPAGLPRVRVVEFEPMSAGYAAITTVDSVTGQMAVAFNADYAAVDLMPAIGLLMHELAHQHRPVGRRGDRWEELSLHAWQALVGLLVFRHHPDLLRAPSALSASMAQWSVALFNGGLDARLGVLATNGGRPLLPGSSIADVASFERMFEKSDVVSPGNALWGAYLAAVAHPGAASCPSDRFDRATFECLDRLLGALSMDPGSPWSPAARLAMAEAFRLR